MSQKFVANKRKNGKTTKCDWFYNYCI